MWGPEGGVPMIELVLNVSLEKIPTMPANTLVRVMQTCAMLRHVPSPEFYDAFCARMQQLCSTMDVRDFKQLLWCSAALGQPLPGPLLSECRVRLVKYDHGDVFLLCACVL